MLFSPETIFYNLWNLEQCPIFNSVLKTYMLDVFKGTLGPQIELKWSSKMFLISFIISVSYNKKIKVLQRIVVNQVIFVTLYILSQRFSGVQKSNTNLAEIVQQINELAIIYGIKICILLLCKENN